MTQAQFGSISSGTMRPEDLIPAFADELASFKDDPSLDPIIVKARSIEDYESEEAGHILDELYASLNEYAPPYGFFGASLDDGADYGFWLQEDWQQGFRDNGGLEVSDTSEVPADYTGEVLHVNDHGNPTLYSCENGKLNEIWALV